MSDEPVTTRELIAGYRAIERPPEDARDRMWRALEARRAQPVAPAPPRRRAPAIWLALAAALALIGLSSYLLLQARQDARTAPGALLLDQPVSPPQRDLAAPIERREAREPSREPTVAPPTPIDAPPPTDDPPRPAPPRRTRPAKPPIDPGLAELALIQQSNDALDAGRAKEALARVEQHAREFARGSLAEEREALRVVALCGADEPARGGRAQLAFLAAYPRSAYRERVRTACPGPDEN